MSKQTIDVSQLSGWSNLSEGTQAVTVKTIVNGVENSASSNVVTVEKTLTKQTKEVSLLMVEGDQTILPDANMTMEKAIVKKPATLIPSNIKQGVSIGGVVGELTTIGKEEVEVSEELNMANGNLVISPPDNTKTLSQVTIIKPDTFIAENIKKDVNIGGITGTLETQKEEEAGTATITENGSQTFSPTVGKVFSNFTVTTNVPTGVDTSDATAVASDILSGKTAYAKGVKLTGSVETYNGAFVVNVLWKASVSNLGAEDPTTVVFDTPADSVPKPWSEVEFNGDVFIKFPKMYKKIVTVTDNQITAFEIASKKIDNDYKLYPCFIDESGNELDYILVGKYMSKSSTTCNSVASGSVIGQTISKGRTRARGRGNGYQLMDWRIQRLWQDLLTCIMKTVNTNSGSGITTDALGIVWGSPYSWIDGFCHIDSSWVYSNSPSKYIDSPTALSDGYESISGYTAPTTGGVEIKKLGYDSTQPFFNYPSEVVSNSSYNTYYCDGYGYSSGNHPVFNRVGESGSGSGAIACYGNFNWSESNGVRLCYRPIS